MRRCNNIDLEELLLAFSVEFIRRFEDACEIFLSLMEKQGFEFWKKSR